jgi:hypothetical protein
VTDLSAAPVRPGIVSRVVRALWTGTIKAVRTVGSSLAEGLSRTFRGSVTAARGACRQAVALAWNGWLLLLAIVCLANDFRKPLLIAAGVGVVVGLGSYLAGPVVASLACGVAGFAGSLAASALDGLRRLLAAEPLLAAQPVQTA